MIDTELIPIEQQSGLEIIRDAREQVTSAKLLHPPLLDWLAIEDIITDSHHLAGQEYYKRKHRHRYGTSAKSVSLDELRGGSGEADNIFTSIVRRLTKDDCDLLDEIEARVACKMTQMEARIGQDMLVDVFDQLIWATKAAINEYNACKES